MRGATHLAIGAALDSPERGLVCGTPKELGVGSGRNEEVVRSRVLSATRKTHQTAAKFARCKPSRNKSRTVSVQVVGGNESNAKSRLRGKQIPVNVNVVAKPGLLNPLSRCFRLSLCNVQAQLQVGQQSVVASLHEPISCMQTQPQ